MRIAIAGASGFVGQALIDSFLENNPENKYALIGITRSARRNSSNPFLAWRQADLLDFNQTVAAVEGADIAFYLVHAMLPKSQLSQGHFEDYDLIQADNFAKACALQGVKKIIYLGALIPEHNLSKELSPHLKSRLETESALRAQGANVTVFRAGLILGRGGSTSELLTRLVRRLPIMIAPKWVKTRTEATDIRDAVFALRAGIERDFLHGKSWDLGNGKTVCYQSLMMEIAHAQYLKRIIFSVPFFTPGLSRLWVSLITGAPKELVAPLIKSLEFEMLPRDNSRVFALLKHAPIPLEESIAMIANEFSRPHAYGTHSGATTEKSIRSIQRISLPSNSPYFSSKVAAHAYFLWLPKLMLGFIRIEKESNPEVERIRFLLFSKFSLLQLEKKTHEHLLLERQLFRITGGVLQKPMTGGFLEFRTVPFSSCLLTSIQEYVPRLPRPIYRLTQALLHLWVMRRFGDYLIKTGHKHFEAPHPPNSLS